MVALHTLLLISVVALFKLSKKEQQHFKRPAKPFTMFFFLYCGFMAYTVFPKTDVTL